MKDAAATDQLKRRLSDEGVRVSALLVSTDFASEQAEAHVDWAVRAVHAAAELGAPVVRIDPLNHDPSLGQGEVLVAFNRHVWSVLQRTHAATPGQVLALACELTGRPKCPTGREHS